MKKLYKQFWDRRFYILFSMPLVFLSVGLLGDIYDAYNDPNYPISTELGWSYESKLNNLLYNLSFVVVNIAIFAYLWISKYSIQIRSFLVIIAFALICIVLFALCSNCK